MASLLAAEGLWKDFVPVAFHVDYWAWTASNRISTLPRGRLAIAAWIARPDSPAPVQSAGGWLLPPSQS